MYACSCGGHLPPGAPVNSAGTGRRGGRARVSTVGPVPAVNLEVRGRAFSADQRASRRALQQPLQSVSSSKAACGFQLPFCLSKRLPASHETSRRSLVFGSPCTCSFHQAIKRRPKNRCEMQIKAIIEELPALPHLQPKCKARLRSSEQARGSFRGNASL